MSNAVKTALLLGVLSALLLWLGQALGGAQGLVIVFVFAVGTNFVSGSNATHVHTSPQP